MRVARELVVRCRPLTRAIVELDRELEQRTAEIAPALLELPGCGASPPPSCSPRSARSTASRATPSSPATAASHRSKRAQAASSGTGSTAAATALNCALYRIAITQAALPPRRTRLPRTQTSRRKEPPRGNPLPQTTTRPRRLQHTENEPGLDIGATLAQNTELTLARCYSIASAPEDERPVLSVKRSGARDAKKRSTVSSGSMLR